MASGARVVVQIPGRGTLIRRRIRVPHQGPWAYYCATGGLHKREAWKGRLMHVQMACYCSANTVEKSMATVGFLPSSGHKLAPHYGLELHSRLARDHLPVAISPAARIATCERISHQPQGKRRQGKNAEILPRRRGMGGH